jgi:hypothetical protein
MVYSSHTHTYTPVQLSSSTEVQNPYPTFRLPHPPQDTSYDQDSYDDLQEGLKKKYIIYKYI